MTRLTRAILAGCLVLGVSPTLAAGTLSFDVKFHDTFVQSKGDTISVGDRIILDDALFKDKATPAGRIEGLCTIASMDAMAICNATLVLDDGTIAIQFVNAPPPEKDFAVIGGTGTYRAAKGMGHLTENGDETGQISVDLD
jgi:hypothetical protein